MEVALFIFYFVLFAFIISRIPFFYNAGLGTFRLVFLFALKIAAGFAYAAFYSLPKYYAGSDTWRFYRLSFAETKWLLSDPLAFGKDLFVYGYSRPGNIFSGDNTYWNDLKSNIPVKLLAMINVVTHNSYYCAIIFFNFLFLFGLVGLYRVMLAHFPDKKLWIIGGIFLVPSTLFWCSGVHKDGLILSATGLIIYNTWLILRKGVATGSIVTIVFSLLLIFSLRNYVVIALLPFLFAWYFSNRLPQYRLIIFGGVMIAGVVLFFVVPLIFPGIDLPLYITQKQEEFKMLQGGSVVVLQPLIPSFTGFLRFLPQAIDMAFLRPHVTEIHNLSYLPAMAETLLSLLLLALALLTGRFKLPSPWLLFLLSFSIVILVLCGYTIPFTGAIVRYKSFVLPLIITPLLCIVNWSKIIGCLQQKSKI